MAGLADLGRLLPGRWVWCSFGVSFLPFLPSWLESELPKSTLEIFGPFFVSEGGLSLLLYLFVLVLGGGDSLALVR